jgi:hypothetical protein
MEPKVHEFDATALQEKKSKALVESASPEDAGGQLEVFAALSRSQGSYPFRHAVNLIVHSPLQWVFLSLLPLLFHRGAYWLVAAGFFSRGDLFPTLLRPLPQAVHAGLLVLVVGAAMDALSREGPRGFLATLRRWSLRGTGAALTFLGLRLGIEKLLGTAITSVVFETLPGILALLWVWLHVALELTQPGSLLSLPGRALRRAGQRLLSFPRALLSPQGRGRLLAAGLPLSCYILLFMVAVASTSATALLPATILQPVSFLLGALGFTAANLATALLILTWLHIDLAGRLEGVPEESELLEEGNRGTPKLCE